MNNKVCQKCKCDKPVEEFGKNKAKPDGLHVKCKACVTLYRTENSGKIKTYMREYNKNNYAKLKPKKRKYEIENAEHLREKARQRREKKSEEIRAKKKVYHASRRSVRVAQQRERLKSDPMFRLSCKLRVKAGWAFRRKGWRKDSSTQEILGCDFETLDVHLASTALNNYGYWLENEEYHIDHIVPLAAANSPEELKKLGHYNNLQLLTPEDNRAKGSKLDWALERRNLNECFCPS